MGIRTADLIFRCDAAWRRSSFLVTLTLPQEFSVMWCRYSAYLAPLPLLAAATGVTSSMFAVEGTALNAYLMMLASRFQKERTDANARAVFRCSLWYLPVLLGAFVFHSRNWAPAEEKEEESVLASLRRRLAKVCVHEVIAATPASTAEGSKGGALCPVVVTEKAGQEAKELAKEVGDGVLTTALTEKIGMRMSQSQQQQQQQQQEQQQQQH
jgi:protoheme IX farnesyltransferase